MGKQFENVDCRYGSPMGRRTYGTPENVEGKIRLFRVLLSQGYDDGGAYWGCASSWRDQLYCAWANDPEYGDEYRQFVRAGSRAEARHLLDIPQEKLAKKTEAYNAA